MQLCATTAKLDEQNFSVVDIALLSVLSWSKSRPLILSRYECLPVAKINRVSRISLEATIPTTTPDPRVLYFYLNPIQSSPRKINIAGTISE